MNRIGLKDYLLNEASDSDLLDCAKVYDCYRFNGYGHLESVSNESLLEDARDEVDNIIDWLEGASRYELMDVSSDVELFVDAKDPFEIINEVDCSSHNHGNDIEVNLSRGDKKQHFPSRISTVPAGTIPMRRRSVSQRWRTPHPRATMRTPMAPAPRRCRRRFSRRTGAGCQPHVQTS